MKIGILGGTFDPIHNGHLALAAAAQNQFNLDKIIFVPANIPPHKSRREKMASPQHRYRMAELAAQGKSSWEVSSLEIDRLGISYTAETIKKLQGIYPKAELFFILGADAFSDFDSWHDAESIRESVSFLVAARPGAKISSNSRGKVFRIEMPDYPVASTDIRAKILNPEFAASVLPAAVLQYIHQHKLYS